MIFTFLQPKYPSLFLIHVNMNRLEKGDKLKFFPYLVSAAAAVGGDPE